MSTVEGGGNIVTNGLVLCLDAANTKSYPTTGTTWTDLSRSGNNGTLINGPTFNSSNGGSIVFDGINDYVRVNNFNYGRTGFTVAAWFKFNIYSPFGYKVGIVTKWQTGAGVNNEFALGSEGSSANSPYWPFLVIQGSNNLLYSAQDTSTIQSINTWYYQVGTFDGSYVRLYLNGSLIKTSSMIPVSSVATVSSQPICIAAFGDSFQYTTYLTVPITQIYNRALTAQEIQQNFNATRGRFGI